MTNRTARTKRGEPWAYLLAHVEDDTDECIEWPFASDDVGWGQRYGIIKEAGQKKRVHRVALERTAGPCPPGREAAHSCNNPICFNPRHLRWATKRENSSDREKGEQHGTDHQSRRRVVSDAPKGTVDVPEACRQLGLARQRLYQLLQMGTIESVKLDGRWYVPQTAIDRRVAAVRQLRSNQCISTREVADFFGVDPRTVRDWRGKGLLNPRKINNRLCFSPIEVTEFIPPGMTGPGRPPRRAGTYNIRGRQYDEPMTKGTNGKDQHESEDD